MCILYSYGFLLSIMDMAACYCQYVRGIRYALHVRINTDVFSPWHSPKQAWLPPSSVTTRDSSSKLGSPLAAHSVLSALMRAGRRIVGGWMPIFIPHGRRHGPGPWMGPGPGPGPRPNPGARPHNGTTSRPSSGAGGFGSGNRGNFGRGGGFGGGNRGGFGGKR